MLRPALCTVASIISTSHKSADVPQIRKQPCRIVQGFLEVVPALDMHH